MPIRNVYGVDLELFPASSADSWIEERLGRPTVVHEAISEFLHDGGLFIDVGANIGFFAILAAKRFGADVIAFEPSERELRRLKRNAERNGTEIVAYQVALASRDGIARLDLSAGGSHLMNRIVLDEGTASGDVSVETRRLDGLLSEAELKSTRLVKIDVEGYEMEVLKGMENAWPALREAAFVIEVTPAWLERAGSSAAALYELLKERGWVARGGPRGADQWDEVFVPRRPSRL